MIEEMILALFSVRDIGDLAIKGQEAEKYWMASMKSGIDSIYLFECL